MVAIPLASKSDPAKRGVVTEERLTNLYAIKNPEGARSPFYLNRTPGMRPWAFPSGICRGLFDADGEGLGVFGSLLISFNESGGPTSKGTISGTREVRFAQNNASPRETVIATGTTAYQYNGTLSTIGGDLAAINIVDVICINGIHICFTIDGKGYYSAVNDANNYNAANFFTVPGTGDFKCAMVLGNQFICWRDNAFYVFRHVADDATEPFQLLQGADKPFGCLNTFANTNVGGVACFVDQYGAVRSIGQGYLPQSIGNDGIITDILALEDKTDLRLWGYVDGDRGFLVVYSSQFCWVYDFKEGRWHNRRSYQRITWKTKHYMRFANLDIVAPDQSSGLFYLDNEYFAEGDDHIVWEAVLPPVTNFPRGGTIDGLSFDIETGTALDASASAEDQEPVFSVLISRDAGKTFGNARQLSLGRRGQWTKTLRLNRCGSFGPEGFIVKIQGSGKTPNAIMNLDGDIKPDRP